MRFFIIRLKDLLSVIALAMALAICFVTIFSAQNVSEFIVKPVKKLPIYCVDRQDNKVALTFDAAWGSDKTQAIIDLLNEYNQTATFFVVAFWAEKNADKLKTLYDNGIEVGSHSNTHAHMAKLNRTQIDLELSASVDAIKRVLGEDYSVGAFRCPFGEYNDKVLEGCEERGLKVIQWDVDSHDWMDLSGRAIAERVLSRIKSGSIVLMHNDAKNIVEGLRLILEGLKTRNLTSVHISDLVYEKDYEIDHTGRQILKAEAKQS